MPFALLIIGVILVVTGFQNTYAQFGSQVQKDFTGPNNFGYWLLAIFITGAIGYVNDLQTWSRAFMALIIIAMFLNKSNSNVFANFTSGVSKGSSTAVDAIGAPLAGSSSGGSGGGTSSSGLLGGVSQGISIASTIASFF